MIDDLRVAEREIGCLAVADLPFEDVVVVLACAVRAGGLAREVLAQHRRVRVHRLERIDQRRQFLVFDLDEFRGVGRDVAVVGDDEGDLLVLEQHLAVRQHHLHIARQRRHPMQFQRRQIGGGQHGDHAGQRLCLRGVDALDPGMGIGRAHEVAVQHAGQLHVVHVVAACPG